MRRLSVFGVAILFLAILALPGYAEIDPETIIGLWLMKQNADNIAKDYSGNGNDGRLMNGATWGAGKFDEALELKGNGGHVEFGVNNNLKPEFFTLMAWFNTRKLNGYGHIFQSGKDWDDIAGIVFRVHQDGTFQAAIATGAGNTASWCNGPALSANTWYHAALTFNGTSAVLYIDGNEVARGGGGEILYDNRTVRMGVHPDDTGSAFDGFIDEFALFSEALIQDDIIAIMNNGLSELVTVEAVSPAMKLATTWGEIRSDDRP